MKECVILKSLIPKKKTVTSLKNRPAPLKLNGYVAVYEGHSHFDPRRPFYASKLNFLGLVPGREGRYREPCIAKPGVSTDVVCTSMRRLWFSGIDQGSLRV